MTVKVTLLGRLGNNLFQYALGRIIAEDLDFELDCRRIPKLVTQEGQEQELLPPHSGSIAGLRIDGVDSTLADLTDFFANAPLHLPGRVFETPIEAYEVGSRTTWQGQMLDVGRILRNRDGRQIRLRGAFQRLEYYAPHLDRIRVWFRPRELPIPHDVAPSDVVVNIRRGSDFGWLGWTMPMSYYTDILGSLHDVGRVYVCGTGIDDNVRARLDSYHPIYYDASPIEHFSFMMRFRRMILSNSTFTWWAAFLSEAEHIFAPRSPRSDVYGFTGYQDVDLHMRQSRYHEVPFAEAVPMALCERNKAARVRFEDGDRLAIESGIGETGSIRVTDANRAVIDWILVQDAPIVVDEMARHYHGAEFHHDVNELVTAGLLVIRPTNLDQ